MLSTLNGPGQYLINQAPSGRALAVGDQSGAFAFRRRREGPAPKLHSRAMRFHDNKVRTPIGFPFVS